MKNKEVVRLESVEKTYQLGEVEVHALRGVDMNVTQGEFLSIIGPSGSGKSTLLQLIGALDRPTEGDVSLDGVGISSLSESRLARLRGEKIGFIFQFFNLYPTLNALQNVELPMMLLGVDKGKRRERSLELLEMVGLADRLHHLPSQLSGGQRQRVAIARSLANDPPLILADEPTGNLDSESGGEVLGLFRELNEEGRTIVIVTHDPAVAELTPRLVRLKDGKIMEA